ncbi:MAG: Spy/CpxP family protein refolding chaperone [Sulfuricaulis sp.]
MKSSIKALLVVMTITSAAGVGIAHAFPPGGAHSCGHGERSMGFAGHAGYGDSDRHIDRMADALNLTKAQRDAMRAIVDKARPQFREIHDKFADNHKQLRALMQQTAPKADEVRQLAEAQGRAMANMIVLRTQVRTEIIGVLTDAQREQLQHWHQRSQKHDQSSSVDGNSAAHDLSSAVAPDSSAARAVRVMM